jgi:hypothetical protein
MRAASLAIAAILAGGPFAALAQAPCDAFCAAIKQAVDDRASEFKSLKGAKYADLKDTWRTTVAPPGMGCTVSYAHDYQALPSVMHPKGEPYWRFGCATLEDRVGDARKQLRSLFAAFRRNAPGWKWFKSDDDLAVNYYGGASRSEFYATVTYIDLGSSGNMNFEIHSMPITVAAGAALKPYAP